MKVLCDCWDWWVQISAAEISWNGWTIRNSCHDISRQGTIIHRAGYYVSLAGDENVLLAF
jgi:hypothetical protein